MTARAGLGRIFCAALLLCVAQSAALAPRRRMFRIDRYCSIEIAEGMIGERVTWRPGVRHDG